jgi:preprotein translocase subunit YajC
MWEIALQVGIVILVLLLAFFLLVRPQLKRISEHNHFLVSLKPGDHVVIRGGLIGNIVSFEGSDVVGLAITDTTTVKVDRNCIERRLTSQARSDQMS